MASRVSFALAYRHMLGTDYGRLAAVGHDTAIIAAIAIRERELALGVELVCWFVAVVRGNFVIMHLCVCIYLEERR